MPKQEKFVQIWFATGNKSKAYREAGYSVKNKTDKTINEAACRLSKTSKVLARYRELQNRARDRNDITADRVLQGYGRIAFADFSGFVDSSGEPINPHKLPDDLKQVAGLDVKDKIKALDSLSKHLGLFEEDNKQKVDKMPRTREENEAIYQEMMALARQEKEEIQGRGERLEKEIIDAQKAR